ncbi:GLUTATHIONE PEROXIDASE 5-RELATED [Salix koriyanagi]|uniref:Glutathione peroxidase n=1 Tax=Salix koriyanagi TaxID=2511006 RepID=A0A9Q0U517_9ROSI|nr:GLUTATHIONE PEROXIDASE 5-RELATED [Salix koriyanagi]
MGSSPSVPEKSIHEFTVKVVKYYVYRLLACLLACRGQDVNLGIYKGKVLLVVNVASKCGFTDSNYTQLTDLYKNYKDKGLEILAFPCNQFLKQEPGTSEDAQNFACTRYKADYPIFHKVMNRVGLVIAVGLFSTSPLLVWQMSISPLELPCPCFKRIVAVYTTPRLISNRPK